MENTSEKSIWLVIALVAWTENNKWRSITITYTTQQECTKLLKIAQSSSCKCYLFNKTIKKKSIILQIVPNICGLVHFQEIKNEQSIIIPASTTSLIKLVEYLCPMLSGTKRLLQDELSKDVINEERNFLSDNISLFCWTIKPRRSSRKWLHNAVLPVINTIQNITTIFFFFP